MRATIFLCALVFGCAVDSGEQPGSNEEELTKQCTLASASHAGFVGASPCCTAADHCYVENRHYYCNTYIPGGCLNSVPQWDGSIEMVQNVISGLLRFSTTVCANLTPESVLRSTPDKRMCGLTVGLKSGTTGFFPMSGLLSSACVSAAGGDRIWLHRADPGSGGPACEVQVSAVGP